VGGRNHIFELLSGENINGEEIAFGVAVLSGLRNGDRKNLAWLSLDHHVSSLLDASSFHRNGGGGTGIGRFDNVIVVVRIRHDKFFLVSIIGRSGI